MNFLFEYLIVFSHIYIITIFISGCGYLFKKIIFKQDEKNLFESNIIWGFIPISFIALVFNFFLPLSITVNSIIFISLFLVFFIKKYFDISLKLFLINSFIVTFLAFILLIHSNVNNPDALLYHLPFSKILNEHKILVGVANVHHRFAHISIFQYISSFFYIFVLDKDGLLIPTSILGSSFLIYFLKEFKIQFKSLNTRLNSIIIFLILIVSIYSFSRYSNYGNDAPVHLYYYLMSAYLFKYNFDFKNNLLIKQISMISLFTFFLKPFYIFSLLVPLFFLILNKNFKIFFKSSFFLFSTVFSIAWFLKNFLISGCLIYPLSFTCMKHIDWTNTQVIKHQSIQGEAMSKSWQDRTVNHLDMSEFNQNFEWLTTWLNNHFKVVVEKFLPIVILLIVFSVIVYLLKIIQKKNFSLSNNLPIYIFLFINFIGSTMWFLKFPIYRYGQSYLFCFFLLIFYIFLFRKINVSFLLKYKNFFNFIIILAFTSLFIKNFNRISEKINDSVLPHMYDDIIHSNITTKFINYKGEFTHYIKEDGSLCGYSISPCSEIKYDKLRLKKKYGYKIYFIDK